MFRALQVAQEITLFGQYYAISLGTQTGVRSSRPDRVGHLVWSCQLWAVVQCLANAVPLLQVHICQFVQQYVFAQTNDAVYLQR
jgi:hypothetical protein